MSVALVLHQEVLVDFATITMMRRIIRTAVEIWAWGVVAVLVVIIASLFSTIEIIFSFEVDRDVVDLMVVGEHLHQVTTAILVVRVGHRCKQFELFC